MERHAVGRKKKMRRVAEEEDEDGGDVARPDQAGGARSHVREEVSSQLVRSEEEAQHQAGVETQNDAEDSVQRNVGRKKKRRRVAEDDDEEEGHEVRPDQTDGAQCNVREGVSSQLIRPEEVQKQVGLEIQNDAQDSVRYSAGGRKRRMRRVATEDGDENKDKGRGIKG